MPTGLADGLALAAGVRFLRITAGFAPKLGPPLPGLALRGLGTVYQHTLGGKVAGPQCSEADEIASAELNERDGCGGRGVRGVLDQMGR